MTTTEDRKLGEMILYVAHRSEDDPDFGATILNKILFYADFLAYARRRRSITGQEYQKLQNGPAPRRLKPVLDELIERREAAIQTRDRFGYEQKRAIALRPPDLSAFAAEDISIVDEVIAGLRGFGAKTVSEISHRFLGWQVAQMNETIPYETVFIDDSPPTDDQIEYAEGLVQAGR